MNITTLQTYDAMYYFWDDFWKRNHSEVLSGLLGVMVRLEDGLPVDQAIWEDWTKSLGTNQPITEQEAYDAMIRFISDPYPEFHGAEHLIQFLKDIKDQDVNKFYFEFWKQCIKKAIEHPVPLGIKWADE